MRTEENSMTAQTVVAFFPLGEVQKNEGAFDKRSFRKRRDSS
jgi:hypothetical protein